MREFLKKLDRCYFLKTQELARHGVPDFLICLNRWFVAMEAKASCDEEPRELQKHILERIKKAGGISLVVFPENWEQTKTLLKRMSKGEI